MPHALAPPLPITFWHGYVSPAGSTASFLASARADRWCVVAHHQRHEGSPFRCPTPVTGGSVTTGLRSGGLAGLRRSIPWRRHRRSPRVAVRLRPSRFVGRCRGSDARDSGWVLRSVRACRCRTAAFVAVLVLLPVLLGTAIAVRATSRGRSSRRSPGGPRRAHLHDAEVPQHEERRRPGGGATGRRQRRQRSALQEEGRSRVTGVGRFLRRYSIDERPGCFKVLKETCRWSAPARRCPPRWSSTASTSAEVPGQALSHRRVAGERALGPVVGRLGAHRRALENWSSTFDMILWQTVGAVLRGSGAY
jgi:hypothetical protein